MHKPWPIVLVLSAYGLSMWLLSKVVQSIPLGITHTLWSEIGIIAIVIVGLLAYKQLPVSGQMVGLATITVG